MIKLNHIQAATLFKGKNPRGYKFISQEKGYDDGPRTDYVTIFSAPDKKTYQMYTRADTQGYRIYPPDLDHGDFCLEVAKNANGDWTELEDYPEEMCERVSI